MSKLAAIIGIGSFYCPWFPYALVSVHFCDEIIVVNAGYDLNNPNPRECDIPLEQVSKDISNLNGLGKIVEITHPQQQSIRNKLPLGTQLNGNSRDWYNSNGQNYTLAAELALERGASMLLRLDSDQVCYADCSRLKTDLADQSLIAWIYEFSNDIWHLAEPGPTTPFNDSVFTFQAQERNFFNGNGCAQIHSTRHYCADIHAAHLRYANPSELTEQEKFQHFLNRIRYSKWMNEGKLENPVNEAWNRLKNPSWKPSTVPPPECTLLPGKALREWAELVARMQLSPLPLNSYIAEDAATSAKAF